MWIVPTRSGGEIYEPLCDYAKLTGLAKMHIDNPTESPFWNYQGMCFPSYCDFIDSMKMKRIFITYFGALVSKLVHPQNSSRACAG